MTIRHVAVFDLGKTNAKLALVDLDTRAEVAVVTRPNEVLKGGVWPHFDTDGLWRFLLDGLAQMQAAHGIDGIAVTTHGACGAFLQANGLLAAPVPDYEHDGPDLLAADYAALRPPFAETGSPSLPLGLNLGAQWHWMLAANPALAARTAVVMTWPGYWGWRLTGVASCDVTSLGCHTDLWNPHEGRPSALVGALGFDVAPEQRAATGGRPLLAPALRPDTILGPALLHVTTRTGLRPGTPVVAGIHDSNASLLPHLLARKPPFAVVSTGTWVISMAIGGRTVTLDPARDTLVNVNAPGQPVPSARFMGGREHDVVTGGQGVAAGGLVQVLEGGLMLLPSVQPGSGPFPQRVAEWWPGEPADPDIRAAAAGLYLAMMTAECLGMIGADGPVIVEGPLARNAVYLDMLRTATGRAVIAARGQTGTAVGAALLFAMDRPVAPPDDPPQPLTDPRLAAYAAAWRARVA